VARFFSIFLAEEVALLSSFLFIFFPSHDATVYSYVGVYTTLTIAFFLYAFYLAYRDKLTSAIFMSVVASLTSYVAVVFALPTFVFFAIKKEIKKGLAILVPNIIYCIFYFYISNVLGLAKSQLPDRVNIASIAKQFILQIAGFIDAVAGPSMWCKIYYSLPQLSMPSFIIGVALAASFYKSRRTQQRKYNSRFVLWAILLLFFSFFLFALTGRYPQICFNLGNRTTVYGSLLLVYLFALLAVPQKIKVLVFTLLIFSILGISDHWKKWGRHQQEVIRNIGANYSLRHYSEDKVIYVSGNQYSKYGPFSHIEFFSEDWVPNSIFKLVLGNSFSAKAINKRHRYTEGFLLDSKYGEKTAIPDYIVVYDSEVDRFFKLPVGQINSFIASLPQDLRHWVQFRRIKFIEEIIIKLMPRLKYAF
jgi:hypothetical protein